MPIIVETVKSSSKTPSFPISDTILNMAASTAKAVGVDYSIISDTSSLRQYFVPLEKIGYSGWGILFELVKVSSDYRINCDIVTTLSGSNSPYLDDPDMINEYFHGSDRSSNPIDYCPETCVMIFDENKDTVLFDIHPGETMNGIDLSDTRKSRISFTLFFAKDVNGGVLCGIGAGHIAVIRNGTSHTYFDSGVSEKSAQKDLNNYGLLHLTKMINYLDPSYPEMKSAYISVIRPFDSIKEKMYVSTLYANGKTWGRAGISDSWPVIGDDAHPIYHSFFPIEPFVNY